jgi:hypothetical protein
MSISSHTRVNVESTLTENKDLKFNFEFNNGKKKGRAPLLLPAKDARGPGGTLKLHYDGRDFWFVVKVRLQHVFVHVPNMLCWNIPIFVTV